MEFKNEWNMESAMQVVQHQTVDARLWAEAVEWLILYGPESIREMLLLASGTATQECFPDLKAKGYAPDGQPCYSMEDLASNLDISKDEAKEMLQEKEKTHKCHHFIDKEDTIKIQ